MILNSGKKDSPLKPKHKDYPLDRTDTRTLPPDYKGIVVTSDIDKTYLDTSFSSVRGLLRTAVEKAEDKRSFLGMIPLYQSFRRGLGEEDAETPLYFLSASPQQMRKVLERKLSLDDISYDGITLKRWGYLLRRWRWREIRKHITYKVIALLLNRYNRPESAHIQEILIGDDSESDAEAYLFYADIISGMTDLQEISHTLHVLGAKKQERHEIIRLAKRQDKSQVARIYIHCTTRHNQYLLRQVSSDILMPTRDALQMVVDSYLQGWVSREAIFSVAIEFSVEEQVLSLHDAVGRKFFSKEKAYEVADWLEIKDKLEEYEACVRASSDENPFSRDS